LKFVTKEAVEIRNKVVNFVDQTSSKMSAYLNKFPTIKNKAAFERSLINDTTVSPVFD